VKVIKLLGVGVSTPHYYAHIVSKIMLKIVIFPKSLQLSLQTAEELRTSNVEYRMKRQESA
jgi:hypothetical protein